MKTIGISKKTRDDLRHLREDRESVNDTISRLLENAVAEEYSDEPRRTNIHLTEENLNRIKELKSYPTESYDSIIARLIQSQQ